MIKPTPTTRLQSVCRQFLKICGETYLLDEDHRLARSHGSCEIGIRAMNINIIDGKDVIIISCIMGGDRPVRDRYVELTVEELEELHILGEDYA
jgi:hypothetical protein